MLFSLSLFLSFFFSFWFSESCLFAISSTSSFYELCNFCSTPLPLHTTLLIFIFCVFVTLLNGWGRGGVERVDRSSRVILVGTTHAADNYNGALDAFITCKTLHSQRHADGYDNKRRLPEDQKNGRELKDYGGAGRSRRECKQWGAGVGGVRWRKEKAEKSCRIKWMLEYDAEVGIQKWNR